ncbi:hypothetical protein [Mucilaginibacter sp.]|jgi:hypothetical protein|uniref:hypothetical protein n=1 Tax=Mucilaginibacter sp. TaxID=1882438 RepID=UPI0035667B74
MELLREDLIKLITLKCSSDWNLDIFKDHILINLTDTETDHMSTYRKIKKQVTDCIREHLPERDEDVLFEVRNGAWNCSFKLGKTSK